MSDKRNKRWYIAELKRAKEKYHNDEEYRERLKKRSREYYQKKKLNPSFQMEQLEKNAILRKKYLEDPVYRERVLTKMREYNKRKRDERNYRNTGNTAGSRDLHNGHAQQQD